MSEPAAPRSRRPAHSSAVGLACALALALLAAVVSTSVAQIPAPPAVPTPPDTLLTPEAPDEPAAEPPQDSQAPPASPTQAGPSRLNPFPVVIVAGRQGRRATRVTELSVKGPRGARVVVRCLGERCPMRRARATIPRAERVRVRKAQRVYRAGLVIEIRVTGEDRVGKYTKIRFRRGRTPARSDACLQPGSSKPTACA
jgi:hypothetical protein